MASGREGNSVAKEGIAFASNAAAALNQIINGSHAVKRTAQRLGCSVRMAKYLRAGKCWTVERLSIASARLGPEFARLLLPPSADEVHDRLDRIERQLSEIRNDLRRD